MTQAYRYHRFSTPEQDTGTSLDRQRRATERLCQAREWRVAETLEDKGLSAWKGDHLRVGELGKFRDRVDAGLIDRGSVLVIENLDRLSRLKLKSARRWIEDINEAGIAVAVCQPELFLDEESMSGSNMGTMVLYLLEASRSTGESSRKSDLLLAAQERRMTKAREGIVYTARMPAWLTGQRDGVFEVIEERAEVIRQIYRWCAEGKGTSTITRLLNQTVTPWSARRKAGPPKWAVGYVRSILTGPAVEGEYHRRTGAGRRLTGEVIAYYPRIVPADLVASARSALTKRPSTTGPRHDEARNLFAGLVQCGHCGGGMIRTASRVEGRAYEHLRCLRHNDAGAPVVGDDEAVNARKCVNGSYYRYDAFERSALKQILHLALDDTHFIRPDETGPLMISLAEEEKELAMAEARQRRLLAFVAEEDEAEEAKDQLRALRPTIAGLRVQVSDSRAALERARGQASPEEHLRRVIEVQDAINCEDDDVRAQARRKVQEALRGVVSVVVCRRDFIEGERRPRRQIMMALAGGALAYQFDEAGELIGRSDKTTVMSQHGSSNTGAEASVNDIRRRRSKA